MRNKEKKVSVWGAPSRFWYFLVALISKLLLKILFRHKVEKKVKLEKGKPYVFISHHASLIDAIMLIDAVYPIKANVVIGKVFVIRKSLKFISNALKCIPKSQFAIDLPAIRAMQSVTADNRAIAIYPEGKVSIDGRQLYYLPLGTSKLIKMLNAEVVMVTSSGSFCAKPKHGASFRFGKLKTVVDTLLTREQVKELASTEIHNKINKALEFNDNIYQQENNLRFKCKTPALGFHRSLYKCPKCGVDYQMRSTNTHLICDSCGNSVELTQYGKLIPEEGSTAFERIDLWNEYQRQACREELQADDFYIQTPCDCSYFEEGMPEFEQVGSGIAYIDKEKIGYKGTFKGEPYEHSIPLKSLHTITAKTRECIDLPYKDGILNLYFTENKYAAKFELLVEENYRLNVLHQ